MSQGQSVAEAVRSISVTQFTSYRWRRECGGLKTDQVTRLKELEKSFHWSAIASSPMATKRLRKAVSDLTLEKLIFWGEAHGTNASGYF